MSADGRRLAELRRSGAAGPHVDTAPRAAVERAALEDQVDPWSCPTCGTTARPVEQPNGTFCFNCRTKLETCCEGAPLPPRR